MTAARSVSARALFVSSCVLALSLSAHTAFAQLPAPVLQVSVSGSAVTATWTPVAGATGYRAEAGFSPAAMLAGYEVGNVTTFSLQAPQGVYYLRVIARNAQGLGAPSNVVSVTVSSPLTPPAPPTGLQSTVSGNTVSFTATPPAGATGLLLAAGLAPGQTLAVLPVPLSGQFSVPGVAPGTYFARMHAVNAGGTSAPSNEVQVSVSAVCSAPPAPSVSVQVNGSTVGLSWTASPGAAAYQLSVAFSPGGPAAYQMAFPGSQTAAAFPGVPSGTYYAQVTAGNNCGTATSMPVTIVVGSTGGSGNRTPNPPAPTPPNYIPLPNRAAVVEEMARLYPNELRNSCRDSGGNNTWLFRLVERLRREDTRWGLNWKRARVGDMSQDAITYNYGPESDEGTLYVHVVDVIGAHCGANPAPTWNNVTVLWSTGAKWTLQPYLQAGYPLVP